MIVPKDPVIDYTDFANEFTAPLTPVVYQPVAINPISTYDTNSYATPIAITPQVVVPASVGNVGSNVALALEIENITPTLVNNPIQVAPVAPVTATPIVNTKISVRANVTNSKGNLALTNVAVNNIPTAKTDASGVVVLPNVNATDDITFSYIGYQSKTFKANAIPNPVVLEATSILLDPVSVNTKPLPTPVKKKSNALLWLLGIGATVYVVNEATKEKSKSKLGSPNIVIAKI